MHRSTRSSTNAGELVGAEGLAAPGEAKLVRAGKNGGPPVTDGPSPNRRNSSPATGSSTSTRRSARTRSPRKRRRRPDPVARRSIMPIEVRQVMSAPPPTCDDARHERTPTTLTIGHLLRDLAPQVLGAVARRHGDFAAAEDAVQEALIAAAAQWPHDGIPDNPRGWLYQVAIRRLTDHVRSEIARRRREDVVATESSAIETVVPRSSARSAPRRTTRSCCSSCAVIRR